MCFFKYVKPAHAAAAATPKRIRPQKIVISTPRAPDEEASLSERVQSQKSENVLAVSSSDLPATSTHRIRAQNKASTPANASSNSPAKLTLTLTGTISYKSPNTLEPSCKQVYEAALKGLFTISERFYRQPKFGMAARQLALWGSGMFDGPLALDVIIQHDKIARETIRQGFLNCFARILVAEERIFDDVCAKDPSKIRPEDSDFQKEIASLLAAKEMEKKAAETRECLYEDPAESNFFLARMVIIQDLLEPIIIARRMFSNTTKAAKLFEKANQEKQMELSNSSLDNITI
ncbi:hypothetical protein MMC28_007871 [Mycoblastus sanguinarius]|nr:hypothetical protein [Mycoblastus sanguinarius]